MKKTVSLAAAAALLFAAAHDARSYAAEKADTIEVSYSAKNGQACITGCSDSVTDLVIPEKINGLTVTAVGENAFFGNEKLRTCVIPDSVASIEERAFCACPELRSITIGSGTASISDYTFAACPNLRSFTVSKDNPTYTAVNSCLCSKSGDTLLKYAGDKNALVPDKVKTIGIGAFFNREDITSVSIPKTVTAIEKNAFSGCLSLRSVDIPDSVKSLGDKCFMSCTSLSRVRLSTSMTAIPDHCFYSCTSLNNIVIPANIRSVGESAFFSCPSLSGIYIPKTVTAIDTDAIGRRYDSRLSSTDSIPGFVIKGEKGSAAEKYASDSGLIFGTKILQKGDVTGDGVIDAVDASTVLSEYAMTSTDNPSSLNVEQVISADCDGNGEVNSVDASLILSKYAENALKH
ncbi:leucine-rich repeat protein [Ruminococcus flavefaciens]|uniref:leucine-rich repeat protein n=1 Tax=Ruminococcus flavefaciens TaxID=1265 RepID=UPI0026EEF15A|nr:leucine-rich repeat protein [Ruminococcus flavefaciens]